MTYCVAMLLDTGMVFLSDSRTSAGVDQISTFRKTTVFQKPADRVLVIQSAGNLAITQAVTTGLRENLETPDSGSNLFNCRNMFEAARCIGDALRDAHRRDSETLKDFGVDFNASLILGGQIKGEMPRLFSIYSSSRRPPRPATSRSASRSTASRSSTASCAAAAASTRPPRRRWCRWTPLSAPTSRWGCHWTWCS